MRARRFSALILLILLILPGCADAANPEDRAFAVGIGLDKADGKLALSLAMPVTKKEYGEAGIEKEKEVKTAVAANAAAALQSADAKTSRRVELGQARLLVFGKELLGDAALLRETMEYLERNEDISRKTYVMAAPKTAGEIIACDIKNGPMAGFFVSEYFAKDTKTVGAAFSRDLGAVLSELREDGCTVMPEIKLSETGGGDKGGKNDKNDDDGEEKEVVINGAAVIKDYRLAGFLDETQTRGLVWMNAAKIDFYDAVSLRCRVKVTVDGDAESDGAAVRVSEDEIKREISAAAEALQKVFKADAFRLLRRMKRDYPVLYAKYKDNWAETFAGLEIIVDVNKK